MIFYFKGDHSLTALSVGRFSAYLAFCCGEWTVLLVIQLDFKTKGLTAVSHMEYGGSMGIVLPEGVLMTGGSSTTSCLLRLGHVAPSQGLKSGKLSLFSHCGLAYVLQS